MIIAKVNGKEFDVEEAQDLIFLAQEKMAEALEALNKYYALTKDENTKSYIIDHLAMATSSDHGFISRDKNLDDVRKELDFLEFSDEEKETDEYFLSLHVSS